jgi:hypothetical protein
VGTEIIIIVVVALVAVVAGLVVLAVRHRRVPDAPTPTPAPAPRAPRPEPEPMHGLEDALAAVTDRTTGRSMAERLDDEAEIVDGLRVTDDTGPLLRRALDHVRPDDPDQPGSTEDEPHSDG